MRYPIVIESGSDTSAVGVIVPALPGCFSVGDTLNEAVVNAADAAAAWFEAAHDTDEAAPATLRRTACHQPVALMVCI